MKKWMLCLLTVMIIFPYLFYFGCSNKSPTSSTSNNAPYTPAMPNPNDGAVGKDTCLTLSWICTDPDNMDTLTYDVYIDTLTLLGIPIYLNQTENWHDLHNLQINKTYYWKIAAKDNHGNIAMGPVWRFSTFTGFPAWSTKASMLLPRGALAVTTCNSFIYAVAGAGNSFVPWYDNQVYDPTIDAWSLKAVLPKPLLGVAGVEYNGQFFILGGNNELWPNCYDLVYKYDPPTNAWTQCASMSEPRVYCAAVVLKDKIYAIGGNNNTGYLSSMEAYDPVTNSWSSKTSMSKQRNGLTAVIVNNRIYAIGGYNSIDGDLNLVEEYNPDTDTWVIRQSLPTPRSYLTAIAVNNIVYVIGGRNQTTGVTGKNEAYNYLNNTWQTKSSMPTARAFIGGTTVNGKVFIVGGNNNFNTLTTVEEYDPASEP